MPSQEIIVNTREISATVVKHTITAAGGAVQEGYYMGGGSYYIRAVLPPGVTPELVLKYAGNPDLIRQAAQQEHLKEIGYNTTNMTLPTPEGGVSTTPENALKLYPTGPSSPVLPVGPNAPEAPAAPSPFGVPGQSPIEAAREYFRIMGTPAPGTAGPRAPGQPEGILARGSRTGTDLRSRLTEAEYLPPVDPGAPLSSQFAAGLAAPATFLMGLPIRAGDKYMELEKAGALPRRDAPLEMVGLGLSFGIHEFGAAVQGTAEFVPSLIGLDINVAPYSQDFTVSYNPGEGLLAKAPAYVAGVGIGVLLSGGVGLAGIKALATSPRAAAGGALGRITAGAGRVTGAISGLAKMGELTPGELVKLRQFNRAHDVAVRDAVLERTRVQPDKPALTRTTIESDIVYTPTAQGLESTGTVKAVTPGKTITYDVDGLTVPYGEGTKTTVRAFSEATSKIDLRRASEIEGTVISRDLLRAPGKRPATVSRAFFKERELSIRQVNLRGRPVSQGRVVRGRELTEEMVPGVAEISAGTFRVRGSRFGQKPESVFDVAGSYGSTISSEAKIRRLRTTEQFTGPEAELGKLRPSDVFGPEKYGRLFQGLTGFNEGVTRRYNNKGVFLDRKILAEAENAAVQMARLLGETAKTKQHEMAKLPSAQVPGSTRSVNQGPASPGFKLTVPIIEQPRSSRSINDMDEILRYPPGETPETGPSAATLEGGIKGAVSERLVNISLVGLVARQGQELGTRSRTTPAIENALGLGVDLGLDLGLGTGEETEIEQNQVPALGLRYSPRITTPEIPIPTIPEIVDPGPRPPGPPGPRRPQRGPPIPRLELSGRLFQERPPGGQRGRGVSYGYNPSLAGIASGETIKAEPDVVSGLGLRLPAKKRRWF